MTTYIFLNGQTIHDSCSPAQAINQARRMLNIASRCLESATAAPQPEAPRRNALLYWAWTMAGAVRNTVSMPKIPQLPQLMEEAAEAHDLARQGREMSAAAQDSVKGPLHEAALPQ